MGTLAKKRSRPPSGPAASSTKRRPPPPSADSEIDSDSADGDVFDGPESPPAPSGIVQDAVPADESPEERRLRLAREYLRHAGVSEDAGSLSDEDDDDDDAPAGANATLRQAALQTTGRAVRPIAEKLAPLLCAAAPLVGRGHALPPTCVALAADVDATAVSGGKDSRVIVWDVATGKKKVVFKAVVEPRHKANPALANGHVGNVLTVALSDDAALAVSGGDDGLVRVWDTRSGKLVESLKGHRGPVHGLAFRAASRQLFSASKDRTVKVWDMNDMAYVETLFGHGGEVNAIDSMVKEHALSCGRDGTLRLYKVVEGSQLVFRRAMTLSIDAVAMVSEQRFISGGDDGAVCLWQMNKKKPTAVVEKAHGAGLGCESWISAVAAFRNTDLAVSGAGDGKLRLWKCEQLPKLIPLGHVNLGPGFVNGIAVGRKGGLLAVAVGTEHRLGRWGKIRGARNTIQFISVPS